MAEISFLSRGTSQSANADTLVIQNTNTTPVTQLTFTTVNPNGDDVGDLNLESPGGGADPDTWVIINGVTYAFTFDVIGTVPVGGGSNKFPGGSPTLQGARVIVIDTPVGKFFFFPDGEGTEALLLAVGTGNQRLDGANLNPPPEPVCFCAGTEIATPTGLRLVETLRAGDSVLTEDGRTVQVAWIGVSGYSAAQLDRDPSLRPVRVPAHAFGPGLPTRDLDLSPQHRVVVEGAACELLFGMPRAFVVARHLLGSVAHSPEAEDGVQYVHLMLDTHEIVVGNGLPSESFQPARRMLEIMTGDNLARLNAALDVLGADAMLTRPDALPTLSSREAKVFLDTVKPAGMIPALAGQAAAGRHLN